MSPRRFITRLMVISSLVFASHTQASDLDINAITDGLVPKAYSANSGKKKGVIGNIRGHKGEYFDRDQFNRAFREGASSANDVGLPLANGRELKTLAGYKEASLDGAVSAWQFSIYGWDEDKSPDTNGNIQIHQAGGAMANYGNRYEYVFFLPDIPQEFVDQVEEKLKKSKKSHSKISKGVEVSFPRTDSGQLSVKATFQYNKKTSTGKLKKQVSTLLLESRSMFNRYLSETRHVKRRYLNGMRKTKHANLDKEQFFEVFTALSFINNLSTWDTPSEETDHGYAAFDFKNRSIRFWNYKDSFAVGVGVPFDSSLSEAQQKKLKEGWLKWGQKKLKKGAKSVTVKDNVHNNYRTLVMTVTYPLDGSLKGKQIEKYIDVMLRDKREDIVKSYNKIKKKL